MTPGSLGILIVAALICGLIAQTIGRSKGRPGAGFALGFLLGIIGIGIIALCSKTEKRK
jgi:hypothetical protein